MSGMNSWTEEDIRRIVREELAWFVEQCGTSIFHATSEIKEQDDEAIDQLMSQKLGSLQAKPLTRKIYTQKAFFNSLPQAKDTDQVSGIRVASAFF